MARGTAYVHHLLVSGRDEALVDAYLVDPLIRTAHPRKVLEWELGRGRSRIRPIRQRHSQPISSGAG